MQPNAHNPYGQPQPGQPHGQPQHGQPQHGHPQHGHPQQGHPQQHHPQQGHPQHGHPQQGYPQQGHPQQGHPQQGHPQQGHPQPAYGHPSAAASPYPAPPAAPAQVPGQHHPGQPYPGAQPQYPGQQAQQQQPFPGQQAQQQPQYPGQQAQQQPQYPGQQAQQQPQYPGHPQAAPAQAQANAWGQPNPYAAAGAQPAVESYDPDAMVSDVSPAARAKFIERTYLHLALAISVFVILSGVAQNIPGIEVLVGKMIGHRYSWGVVLALFVGAGYVADKWACNSTSAGMQYMGLGLYTLAEVVIFIPLIYLVKAYVGVHPIYVAGAATLAVFAGLTAYVFITKKDFSFIKGTLTTISMAAFGLIIASIVWGFSLGMVFSAAMIVLGAGYILYYTSNIQQHYRTDQHVAAALALFSALAFVFWYVLRIVLSLARS